MPRRTDIGRILIVGSGPIVIGQGAEFDYSGTQACKALREEGYSVVLINSNLITTLAGARAAVSAIRALSKSEDGHEPTPLTVRPLQQYFSTRPLCE